MGWGRQGGHRFPTGHEGGAGERGLQPQAGFAGASADAAARAARGRSRKGEVAGHSPARPEPPRGKTGRTARRACVAYAGSLCPQWVLAFCGGPPALAERLEHTTVQGRHGGQCHGHADPWMGSWQAPQHAAPTTPASGRGAIAAVLSATSPRTGEHRDTVVTAQQQSALRPTPRNGQPSIWDLACPPHSTVLWPAATWSSPTPGSGAVSRRWPGRRFCMRWAGVLLLCPPASTVAVQDGLARPPRPRPWHHYRPEPWALR